MNIKLIEPLVKDGNSIEELTLDLKKLTGRDMIDAEEEARALGDNTYHPLNGQKGLAVIAAKATGLLVDDILSLAAPDYLVVTNSVNNFLFAWGLAAGMQSSE
ncbi:phage tail assembly protein [Brevibacillus porteri]|uniref:phage tail assembly protein n=1 Tax=Brevibacillus porteri TaxID=2126350 RepID=UPI003D25859A